MSDYYTSKMSDPLINEMFDYYTSKMSDQEIVR